MCTVRLCIQFYRGENPALLLDTRSCFNIISSDMADRLKCTIKPTSIKLCSFTGHKVSIAGEATLVVKIEEIVFVQTFLLPNAKCTRQAILGFRGMWSLGTVNFYPHIGMVDLGGDMVQFLIPHNSGALNVVTNVESDSDFGDGDNEGDSSEEVIRGPDYESHDHALQPVRVDAIPDEGLQNQVFNQEMPRENVDVVSDGGQEETGGEYTNGTTLRNDDKTSPDCPPRVEDELQDLNQEGYERTTEGVADDQDQPTKNDGGIDME